MGDPCLGDLDHLQEALATWGLAEAYSENNQASRKLGFETHVPQSPGFAGVSCSRQGRLVCCGKANSQRNEDTCATPWFRETPCLGTNPKSQELGTQEQRPEQIK